MPNLIYIVGKPLSRSNGIGLGWNMAENLNIPAEITNNKDFFEIYSLIYPSFFSSKMMHYYLLIAVYFSLVVRLLIFHILILFKMKNIEIIHRPVWAIIIVIFLFLGFAWCLCAHISFQNNFFSVWLLITLDHFFRLKWSSSPHIKKSQKLISNLMVQ